MEADVVLLNGLGLDPGLDHMNAMAMLDNAKAESLEVGPYSPLSCQDDLP